MGSAQGDGECTPGALGLGLGVWVSMSTSDRGCNGVVIGGLESVGPDPPGGGGGKGLLRRGGGGAWRGSPMRQ